MSRARDTADQITRIDSSAANATAITVDSSENVGIGTSSPSDVFHVVTPSFGGITLECTGATADPTFKFLGDSGNYWSLQQDASQSDSFQFRYNNSEKIRIASSGLLLVGTTTPAQTISTDNVLTLKAPGIGNVWGVGPTTSYGNFYISQGGTGVALSAGSTSWGTVSDERMKDIIEPITGASSKVASLRTVIGKYKTDPDDARRSFLIAQDVQAVLPEAIDVGEDADSTLSIKYTEVIPLLTAALQEALTEITDLKARVAALEAN